MEVVAATFLPKSLRTSLVFPEESLNFDFPAYKHQFLEKVEGCLKRSDMPKPQEITPPLIYPIWKSKTKYLLETAVSTLYEGNPGKCDKAHKISTSRKI